MREIDADLYRHYGPDRKTPALTKPPKIALGLQIEIQLEKHLNPMEVNHAVYEFIKDRFPMTEPVVTPEGIKLDVRGVAVSSTRLIYEARP